MAGRGFGKTRIGSEACKEVALSTPGARIALIAPSYTTGRIVMIEGESGILGLGSDQGVIPKEQVKSYNISKHEILLHNGSYFKLFSAEDYPTADKIRGNQFHFAWFDELAAMNAQEHAWNMIEMAVRLGDNPRIIATTTPKPTKLLKQLVKDPGTIVITGTTYDNSDNLPATALARMKRRYESTALGRQELLGQLLDEATGALWTSEMINSVSPNDLPSLVRIVVAIDPAGSHKENSDETGIVAVGLSEAGHLYVLRDESGRYSPEQWADRAINLYTELEADSIIAETNFGGEMVKSTLRNRNSFVPVRVVRAKQGKKLRAEPVVSLYERGLVHHVGDFAELEAQQLSWVPPGRFDEDGEAVEHSKDSPDRVDALVYACSDLVLKPEMSRGSLHFFGD